MMERMGVPPPRELYPEMMRLEGLTPERQKELIARARRRRSDGSARLSLGLEDLDRAIRDRDREALFEALANARAGFDELETGLATERALEAGEEPRKIALDWYRDAMRLELPIRPATQELLGVSWFHAFVMGLLTLFAVTMVGMYFQKMRRAASLLADLSGGDTLRAASPGSSVSPATPTASPQSAPANTAAIFEMLRKTGSCSGCKNPCATRFRVAQIIEEAPDVKTFRLAAIDGGPLPFEYLPGQFLNVIVPGEGPEGLTKRSYTIASTPTQAAYCEITVKRDPAGTVSRYLHDSLQAGDEIKIAAPYGRFTFTGEEASSILLIGGGVGITPLMSVIRYLADRSWTGKITLLFGFATPADFVFREELTTLERRHANLQIVPIVERPEGTDWTGRTGLIDAELVRKLVPDVADRIVHVCGPKPMMDAVRSFLPGLGIASDRIRFESFGPAAPTPRPPLTEAESVAAPTVSFSRSEKSAPLPAGLTVLDVADSVGVDIEWSCRSGTCGSCAVRLLSGEVTMDVEDGLDPDDRKAGMILACQAHASDDLTVEA